MSKAFAWLRFCDEAIVEESLRLQDRGVALPTQRKFKDSGQMIAPATIARVGIMEYRASELGSLFADRDPMSLVKVMTREEDLFCADSLETYRSAPITIGHPADDVTIENSKELQHGNLDGMPFRDGDQLAAHIVLSSIDAINVVETGADELSSGHDAKLIRLSDEDAAALGYDCYKSKIVCNHVAIVKRGRAGDARIADAALDEEDEKVKMYDEEFVAGLQAKLAAAEEQTEALKLKLADAEVKLSDEAINAIVASKLAFRVEVAKFTDADISELSEVEAMKVAIKDSCGRDYSDKDDAFIRARYAILVEEGAPEQETDISAALRDEAAHKRNPVDNAAQAKSAAEAARARMIERNSK